MINRASAQKEIQRLNKRVEELEAEVKDSDEAADYWTTEAEECIEIYGGYRKALEAIIVTGDKISMIKTAKQALKLTIKEQT
jgi:cell division protein FtsB